MKNILLIFFGAGIGGVLRYWTSNFIHSFSSKQFPYGTLFVNVTGSLLMGVLFIIIVDRFESLAPQLRSLLLIGLLGGYTTFSTFSIETINLIENGQWMAAIANVLLSVFLCVMAAGIGVIGARLL